MVRVFMLYEQEPDAEAYERHAELCRQVPGGTFRHGKVFGAPMGDPKFPYYAEWEFADMDAFKAAARTDEFMATGKDAMEMGHPVPRPLRERRVSEPTHPAPRDPAELGFERIVYEKAPPRATITFNRPDRS